MKIVSNVKGRWVCATTCAKCLTQVELEENDLIVKHAHAITGQPRTFEYACPICKDIREIEAPRGRGRETVPVPATIDKNEEDKIEERRKEQQELEQEQERRREEDREKRMEQMSHKGNPACTMR